MAASADAPPDWAFEASVAQFEMVRGFLCGSAARALTHAELEGYITTEGRELLRLLLQGHLDLRAANEARRDDVVDEAGVPRSAVEEGHQRSLTSVVGELTVTRMAYRRRGETNLHPADADLNLPEERHSHGLRRLAATGASRGSYEEAQASVAEATGVLVGKRQLEQLAAAAAKDFEAFYDDEPRPEAAPGEVVVISADGKGIVMRPSALRPATAAAAANANAKLAGRLSKGEKRNRKRIAEVGAVYTVTPAPRTPGDVLATNGEPQQPPPRAADKWLTASVVDDAREVIARVFDEAERRDARHGHPWVALVDGNNHQIDRIRAEAAARNLEVAIVVDVVHVLEYLWSAAWSFFAEGDPDAEAWVGEKALAVLEGRASIVAASIRRKATTLALEPAQRANADRCADYLLAKAPYLDYPTALARGWPIATGVIEGACRHIVKDRMDVTGARWGLDGAEAVLKLRVLRANGDFDNYFAYHLAREQRRVHQDRYLNGAIPRAA